MCNFCILFDYSTAMAKVDHGVASIVKAPEGIPFLRSQQFNFCPVCGSPRDDEVVRPSKRFGQNLRRVRRMRGLTQQALGNAVHVQRSTICKYEKGRIRPNVFQFAELCRVLDINPKELL